MNLPQLPWDAVSEHDHKIVTTSLKVAEVFGKQHKNVLRDIEKITGPKSGASEGSTEPKSGLSGDPIAEFAGLNFELSEYVDPTGRKLPMVEMTKDGFTLLVMGYSGEKAMLFKIAYIAQFNRMAERLARADFHKALAAERAYFERYPERRTMRELAMVGEPYWYIGQLVGRAAATVGKAIRDMVKWGMMDGKALALAREGMSSWWAYRRQHRHQLSLL